jgi:hypothetical protein
MGNFKNHVAAAAVTFLMAWAAHHPVYHDAALVVCAWIIHALGVDTGQNGQKVEPPA